MNMFGNGRYYLVALAAIATVGLMMAACSSPEPKAVGTKTTVAENQLPAPVEAVEPAAAPAPVDAVEPEVASAPADAVETDATPAPEESAEVIGASKSMISSESVKVRIEGTPEVPAAQDPASFEPKLRPYAESPYADRIDAGLMWIAANNGQQTCNWTDYCVLDYLQRKFALDDWFAAQATINVEKMDAEELANYTVHARMVKPEHDLDEAKIPFENLSLFSEYKPQEDEKYVTTAALKHLGMSISGTMLQAMYCDKKPVDDAFVAALLRQARDIDFKGSVNSIGGYVVAHMILSYQWLKELGCADAHPDLADVGGEFADLLVAMVEDQGAKTDLAMEAMVLLHYLGYPDRVSEDWVNTVAEAQLPDGSWDRNGGTSAKPTPQGHTTDFALWILLENALPETEDIPWLR